MTKKVLCQYRYFGEGSSYNTTMTTKTSLCNGGFLAHIPVVKLGIQAPPGTKFRLNNSLDCVEIGLTGVLELDFTDGAQITSMRFDSTSLSNPNGNIPILIDTIYEEEED